MRVTRWRIASGLLALLLGTASFASDEAEVLRIMGRLRDPDPAVRFDAVGALSALGARAAPAVEALAAALDDPDAHVAVWSAKVLEGLGPAAALALPALVAHLEGSDIDLKVSCINALGGMEKSGAEASRPLLRLLEDSSPQARAAAQMALVRIGSVPPDAIPAVLAYIGKGDWVVPLLLKTGRAALDPLDEARRKAEGRREFELARRIEDVLYRIAPDRAPPVRTTGSSDLPVSIPELLALLEKDAPTRGRVISQLAHLGRLGGAEEARQIVPALMALLPKDVGYILPALLAMRADVVALAVEEIRRGRADRVRGLLDAMGGTAFPGLLAALDDGAIRLDVALIVATLPAVRSPDVRAIAAAGFRRHADALVPELLKDLGRATQSDARATALALIGPSAVPAVQALLRDPIAGNLAILALARMGEEAEAAIPALLELLETTPGSRPRIDAARALIAIGPSAVEPLRRALERPQARFPAALALAVLGGAPIESLLPIIVDPPPTQAGGDSMDFWTAVGEICWIGRPAYDLLLERSASGDARAARLLSTVIEQATDHDVCWMMGLSGGPDKLRRAKRDFADLKSAAVPALERAAGNDATRQAALTILAALGQPSSLIAAARSTDSAARVDAAAATSALKSPRFDEAAVESLISLLRDPSPDVRAQAVVSLRSCRGAAGMRALPALLDAVREADDNHCGGIVANGVSAARCLKGEAPARIAAALVPLLARERCRRSAGDSLAGLAPDSLPALLDALRADDALSWAALGVLAGIGERGAPAVPALIELASSPSPTHRAKAVEALGAVGPRAAAAVPVLISLLGDAEVGWKAVSALGGIGSAAVPSLIEALADPKRRIPAVVALGKVGPPASAAFATLSSLRKARDPELQAAVSAALSQIGTPVRH
jgi:HEAT repeat protein